MVSNSAFLFIYISREPDEEKNKKKKLNDDDDDDEEERKNEEDDPDKDPIEEKDKDEQSEKGDEEEIGICIDDKQPDEKKELPAVIENTPQKENMKEDEKGEKSPY